MAIRQYIGARYVPRFMGLYDVTQVYQALDVVDNGAGTSYIAKKTVPAGTVLSNTDYWFVYGATSGAILDIQTRLGAAENDIDNLELDVSALQSGLTAANNNITDLKRYTTNRRYVFIGDSYDRIGSNSWVINVCNILGITDYVRVTQGGYGFYRDGTLTWENLLRGTTITDPETVTDVVICGGANDSAVSEANLQSAMESFNTYIKGRFPNLKNVYLGWIAWRGDFGSLPRNMENACGLYQRFGKLLGWRLLHNVEYPLHDLQYMSDVSGERFHPTSGGVTYISRYIAQALLTGSCDVRYIATQAFSYNSAVATGSNFTLEGVTNNGATFITIPDIAFTAAANIPTSGVKLAESPINRALMQHMDYIPFTGYVVGGNVIVGNLYMNSETELYLWVRSGTVNSGDAVRIPSLQIGYETLNK